jgi:phage tail sheath protein FI
MTDPLGGLRPVPPSGHIAGIYARVENRTGPHKPPANELIEDAPDVSLAVGHVLYGDFNDYQINVLRTAPGRGLRVLGERTLSNDAIWRYVNVRRLLISIERTIDRYTQWIVFEPNNRDLWRDMDRVIRLFLDDIWHRGWLDGDAAEQAYTVQCNASTNPPEERDLGRVVTAIGVLPPWPAEFVVVRIGKTEAGTQVLEGASG